MRIFKLLAGLAAAFALPSCYGVGDLGPQPFVCAVPDNTDCPDGYVCATLKASATTAGGSACVYICNSDSDCPSDYPVCSSSAVQDGSGNSGCVPK